VEGVVTLDGSSLSGATIVFRPVAGGPAAAGVTDASGRYVMTTLGFRPGAGVLAGDYVVSIRKYKAPEDELPPKPKDPGALAQWQTRARTIDAEWSAAGGPPLLTPPPYANEASSGLSVTIVPGHNTLNFALEAGFQGQPAR
jgi:hypothetical protein